MRHIHLDIVLQQKCCSPVFKMFIVECSGRVEGRDSRNTVTARALASKVAVHASDKVRVRLNIICSEIEPNKNPDDVRGKPLQARCR